MVTLVIVEQQELVRLGLSAVLRREEHIEVLGDYGNSGEMMRNLAGLNPDVVVISAAEVTTDGGICHEIRKLAPSSNILVLTDERRDDELLEIILSGASAYHTKQTSCGDLLKTIEIVATGGACFETDSLARLLKPLQGLQAPGTAGDANRLSDREKTILALLAKGYSNGEIGDRLFISKSTVRNGITQIRNKLNINSRTQLAVYAVQRGIAHYPILNGASAETSLDSAHFALGIDGALDRVEMAEPPHQ